MPVIQQEGGVRSIKGLPLRWGKKAYAELKNATGARYNELAALLDEVIDAPLPLDVTDSQIVLKAQAWSDEVRRQVDQAGADRHQARRRVDWLCRQKGIDPPLHRLADDEAVISRGMDAAWWRRQLRKIHGRKFEHAAIRLGFVSSRSGPYASNETVARRIEQNKRNAKILENVTMTNELNQSFSLADLAAKSTGNKALRRGELMLRIAGFEDIAKECGHDGLFVTLTCPSRFHAVIQGTGKTNPDYDNSTPRQAQQYLCKVWARIRAALARAGVGLYGFRIAEPHHDACPHWHLLLFVQPFYRTRAWAKRRVIRLFKRYAWQDPARPKFPVYRIGGGFIPRMEPGRARQGVKIEEIDPAKGGAAGYVAKYVGKNIDGEHVGEHTTDGEILAADGDGIKPSQRVEAWAAKWGIRQFQQIGGAPVTVWRELRRIREKTVQGSPGYVLDAWRAAQRIEAVPMGQDKPVAVKAADFAAYLRAQGGAVIGRRYKVRLYKDAVMIQGRYGLHMGQQILGVYDWARPNQCIDSVRYKWTRGSASRPAFAFPWSPVNNCTHDRGPFWEPDAAPGEKPDEIDEADWYESHEFRAICFEDDEIAQAIDKFTQQAQARRAATVWTQPAHQVKKGSLTEWTI